MSVMIIVGVALGIGLLFGLLLKFVF